MSANFSSVVSYILMAFTSGHALGSNQICEQLYDSSKSSSEITPDSDIDIIEHSDPDAKIKEA